MANIRVDVDYTIADGAELLFYAPCDFANISGLKVYYPGADAGIVSHEFTFQDAHKNDLSNLDNLFAEGACVKVILSLTNSTAYIQNADTNAYLEGRFDEFVDGTTQVGNAKTLDGHGAEYFFPKSGGMIDGDVTQETTKNGSAISKYLKNLVREVREYIGGSGVYRLHDVTNGKDIITSNLDGTNTFNGTASGNLPLTGGGTVSKAGRSPIELKSTNSNNATTLYGGQDGTLGELGFIGANTPTFRSTSGVNNTLLHTGNMADHVLTKSGGRITAYSTVPLELQSTNSDDTLIMHLYNRNDGSIGSIGFRQGLPTLRVGTGTWQEILHTGNKPTGTYTGNGSATSRTVNVGGVGSVLAIYGNGRSMIVTSYGAFGMKRDDTSMIVIPQTECKYSNGVLTLATTNAAVNAETTFNYEVL